MRSCIGFSGGRARSMRQRRWRQHHGPRKIVDRYGTGAPGATLVLGDRSITSDSNGSFTFSDVSRPYDLAQVILDEVPTQYAIVYSGLTRADPVLSDHRRLTTFSSASMTGNLTGYASGEARAA